MRLRGRKSLLEELRSKLTLERFDCDGVSGDRVVMTDFYALDTELDKLEALDVESIALQDRVTALRLVVHDLKTRSTTPTNFVREHFRIYRDSWIMPVIADLLKKESKRG